MSFSVPRAISVPPYLAIFFVREGGRCNIKLTHAVGNLVNCKIDDFFQFLNSINIKMTFNLCPHDYCLCGPQFHHFCFLCHRVHISISFYMGFLLVLEPKCSLKVWTIMFLKRMYQHVPEICVQSRYESIILWTN